MENKKLLFCVSAFLEIGRGSWANHGRKTEEYLNHFAMFWGNINAKVLIFCEEYFKKSIEDKIKEFESNGNEFKSEVNIQIFKREDLNHFKNIDKIKTIQASEEMKKYSRRDPSGPPEYTSPEWTAIMLSKPHFLKMANDKGLIPEDVQTVAWTDFGIAHCGHNPLYVDAIKTKTLIEPTEAKITFFNKRNVDFIADPWHLNSFWDDTFAVGGFYLVPKNMIDIFIEKFDNVVYDVLMKQNIIDDDQTVMSLVGKLYSDVSRFEDSFKYINNPPEGDFFPVFYTLE